MNSNFQERMESKSIRASIINNISKDFNLTPILAEAYFNQIKEYFQEHSDIQLTSGQVHYLAIDDREPAGKPVSDCRKVSVLLTLHDADKDLAIHKNKGLKGLRQERLLRITKEAIEQGALLSYEDIAFLLTTSVITVKRDIANLRRNGLTIPSRGWIHDMGRGTTHKTEILSLYLRGYQFSEIEARTHHSEKAVQRYIQDFARIILLKHKNLSIDQIRIATGFSNRLIQEYFDLFDKNIEIQNPQLAAIFDVDKKKGIGAIYEHTK